MNVYGESLTIKIKLTLIEFLIELSKITEGIIKA